MGDELEWVQEEPELVTECKLLSVILEEMQNQTVTFLNSKGNLLSHKLTKRYRSG